MTYAHHRLRIQLDDGAWITTKNTEGAPEDVAQMFQVVLSDNTDTEPFIFATETGHEVIRPRDIKRVAIDHDPAGDLLRALNERGD